MVKPSLEGRVARGRPAHKAVCPMSGFSDMGYHEPLTRGLLGQTKPRTAQAARRTRCTRISFSRSRVCAISQADRIRISVSIFTPNAFPMHSAISRNGTVPPLIKPETNVAFNPPKLCLPSLASSSPERRIFVNSRAHPSLSGCATRPPRGIPCQSRSQ